MKLNVKKFQEGGMAPEAAPQEMPAEGAPQGGGQEEQIMQALQEMAMQIAQQLQDPQLIMALAQMLMEMAQGGAQPEQPAMRRQGGRLVRVW